MTLTLVDEIEQLHNCRTHQECARWLLTCPLSLLMKYEMTIKNRLRTRGFLVGVEYLEHLLASLRARRPLDLFPYEVIVWTDAGEVSAHLVRDVAAGVIAEEDQPFPPIGGEGEAI